MQFTAIQIHIGLLELQTGKQPFLGAFHRTRMIHRRSYNGCPLLFRKILDQLQILQWFKRHRISPKTL